MIFEGVPDSPNETEVDCIHKLRGILHSVHGLNSRGFVIDRIQRLDGKFVPNSNRRVLCVFNWFHDVWIILKNRKYLPKGIFVNEDLPEEWVDRRRILRPVFMAAKKNPDLKHKTHMSKDQLIIDGNTFTAAPKMNILEANKMLDVPGTCQRVDDNKVIFLGCHSVFSNLHSLYFTLENVGYNCVEQCIQSAKAALFNDDVAQARIMKEVNPYKIKKIGSKVKNFSAKKWKKECRQIAYYTVCVKFIQNINLGQVLLNTGTAQIAESSTDQFWGTGLHLHDRNAMDQRYWKNDGSAMSEIYEKLCQEMRRQ